MHLLRKTSPSIRTRTSVPRTSSGATVTRYATHSLAALLADRITQTLFWNDKYNHHKKDDE
jgi:hypothetical protein